MPKGYFITGSDTDIGKTRATLALMRYLQNQGKVVAGMKPVAAGCTLQEGRLKNSDALALIEHASRPFDYDLVNPYAYELSVSPHIAGEHNPVNLNVVRNNFAILAESSDLVLVEGAGGWYSPVNGWQDNSDLAKALGLPVILVVAIRLGCINQARLVCEAVRASGLPCLGWLAVCVDPVMLYAEQNIATIKARLGPPLFGIIPYDSMCCADSMCSFISL